MDKVCHASLFVVLIIVHSGAVMADEIDRISMGRALFEKVCAHCHAPGPGHPGTYMLGQILGQEYAVIEDRYIAPSYVRLMVRRDIRSMPAYRKSELDDGEVDAIAYYLARHGQFSGQFSGNEP